MSQRKTRRNLERLSGQGKVLRDHDKIADVEYFLTVDQEVIEIRSQSGTSRLDGLKDISGSVTVVEGQRNLSDGNTYTLVIEDGRRMQFFAKSWDPISGRHEIINAGGEGLA